MKGVKKAYLDPPPPTGQLPEHYSGSMYRAELDKREAGIGYKAHLQPPPTGQLVEPFAGSAFKAEYVAPIHKIIEPRDLTRPVEQFSGSAFNPKIYKARPLTFRAALQPGRQRAELFSGSIYNANLDRRKAGFSYKATLQPLSTGKLPTFFNGEGKVIDNPFVEHVKLISTLVGRARITWEGKKNTRRNRSATLSFHKTTIKGRR